MELVQAGLLIAIYEHARGMQRDAWLTVGNCARIGHLLGLHTLLRQLPPRDVEQRVELEDRRRLWWGVVVLERSVYSHCDVISKAWAP